MNRSEFLADGQVTAFVQWASHLVTGEWGLEHSYKGKGPGFRCTTLYEAFRQYHWPNPFNGPSFGDTIEVFENYRHKLDRIDLITHTADQREFFDVAQDILKWGGINNLRVSSDRHWGRMQPADLQNHISEVKRKLDPAQADTDDLPESLRMSSGFSKIYSALIPDLPIYDSRVACALTCLLGLYQKNAQVNVTGETLSFPVPAHRGSERCTYPAIRHDQVARYAAANLKCAWLLQELLTRPGEFASVPELHRVDALQSALFMLGYAQLGDEAVVKPGQKSNGPRQR